MITSLNFPAYDIPVREEAEQTVVFDPVRKRWVSLTPEEWVRQHVIRHLSEGMGYPAGLISVEGQIRLYKTLKRYDVAVFGRDGSPKLVVECKAPGVPLSQAVIDQIVRYNMALQAPCLLITNGRVHIILRQSRSGYEQAAGLPPFDQL